MKLVEIENGAQQEKFVGGSNQITWKLKEKIENLGGKVLLSHEVLKIEQHEKVIVFTNNGEFVSNYVVMAIPPTQAVKIKYYPPVPFQREQVRNILLTLFDTL